MALSSTDNTAFCKPIYHMYVCITHRATPLRNLIVSVVNALVQAACPVTYMQVGIHTICFKHLCRSAEAGATAPCAVSRGGFLLCQSNVCERTWVLIPNTSECNVSVHSSLCFGAEKLGLRKLGNDWGWVLPGPFPAGSMHQLLARMVPAPCMQVVSIVHGCGYPNALLFSACADKCKGWGAQFTWDN